MPIGSPFVETVLTWLPKTEGAYGNGELVFIEVTESEGQEKGFLDGNPNQNQMEIMAAQWLAASSPADGDLKVRFDTISLIVLNEQRAFFRHHTNVFSQA